MQRLSGPMLDFLIGTVLLLWRLFWIGVIVVIALVVFNV